MATENMSLDDRCSFLSEENKKLKVDLSSLQISNRSLVNQNRDVKKKVMDYRLQMSDLEGRLKNLESVKQDLIDTQSQCDNLRSALDKTETKLTDIEYRASQAEDTVSAKEKQLLKQKNLLKDSEEKLQHITDDRDRLVHKTSKLEIDLSEAQSQAKYCQRIEEQLKDKSELLEKLIKSSKLNADEVEELSEGEEKESYEGMKSSSSVLIQDFLKNQEAKFNDEIKNLEDSKKVLEVEIKDLFLNIKSLESKIEDRDKSIEEFKEKCKSYQTKIKELNHQNKKTKDTNAKLIGPAMPPWINAEQRKRDNEKNTMEKLANADPATLRTRLVDLEGQVSELNNLLTYREDVILRIHEEISKKALQLEQVECERATLKAQVDIIKKELSSGERSGTIKNSSALLNAVAEAAASVKSNAASNKQTVAESEPSKAAMVTELEAECERLRGKRDREYQRRKRLETEMDEIDKDNVELKAKLKQMEDTLAAQAHKIEAQQADSAEKARIAELQSTVNQLRVDNEAKRCEMFDLRNKYEEKIAHCDKLSAETKNKETKCQELTAKLKSTEVELLEANKDLETVRCKAIRGGPEVQRLQGELQSMQTTCEFLKNELNSAKLKLKSSEAIVSEVSSSLKKNEAEAKTNGVLNGVMDDVDLMSEKLTATENRLAEITKMSEDLAEENKTLKEKVTTYSEKISKLKNELGSSSKKRKRKDDDDESSKGKRRKTRFDNVDDESEGVYCSSCTKTRGKLIECESQLKAALEREASIRSQLKELKAAGGNAVEIQTQLIKCRTHLKITVEASDRLLSALGPSMYDDPAVLSMREVLNEGRLFKSFVQSLKIYWNTPKPVFIGKDEFGNRFFETPINKASQTRNKYPMRYLLLPGQSDLHQPWMELTGDLPNISNEWDMWLRHRRKDPPTIHEVLANKNLAQAKVGLSENVEQKIDEDRKKMISDGLLNESMEEPSSSKFPAYHDLETTPGEGILDDVSAGKAGQRIGVYKDGRSGKK